MRPASWLLAAVALIALALIAPAQELDSSQLPAGALVASDGPLPTFLPADEAFRLEYGWRDDRTLQVRWVMPPGYYLYRKQMSLQGDGFEAAQLPPGKLKHDEFFGESEVYYGELSVPMRLQADAPDSLQLQLRWQGCAEAGLCYPPEKTTLVFGRPNSDLASAPARADSLPQAEDQRLAAQLSDGALWLNLLLFVGLGLLLAFTPCVLPMVPILSSLLVGAGAVSRGRNLALSASYVLAMALTYAAAGAAAAATGASLQSALQTPWVLIAFSMLMVALALSMFGLYELRLPTALNNWLTRTSNKQQGGNLAGVAMMGMLSALIVGPCVAPPLIGVLVYISQSGNLLVGALTLFALGIGMGLPLMFAGAALGEALPRAGGWMQQISRFFGFGLLGLAVWFLERLVSAQVAAALWGTLAVVAGLWLFSGSVPRLAAAQTGLQRAVQLVLLLLALLILLWGGAQLGNASGWVQVRFGPSAPTEAFVPDAEIHSLAQFKAVLAAEDKPVILDFYADWCVECKQMEARVFPDPKVQRALRRWHLVRADVTANDAVAKELLRHYGVLGPPTLLFFDAADNERRGRRGIGYLSADQLVQRLEAPER